MRFYTQDSDSKIDLSVNTNKTKFKKYENKTKEYTIRDTRCI